MITKIRAIYRNGVIELLKKIDIAKDAEITITVSAPVSAGAEGIGMSFGGWKDLIDAEQFLKDIYESRGHKTGT